MIDRGLTEVEIEQLLKQVKNKLVSMPMENVNNVEGRTISIVNDEVSKRSGGIMMSPTEVTDSMYLGNYYSLDDFMKALDNYIKQQQPQTSTFTKKGKIKIDQTVVSQALEAYSSLYVAKKEKKEQEENKSKKSADFYVVSRADENSVERKKTGGLITPNSMTVKEGRYIDEQSAMAIAALGVVEIPTKQEVEKAVQNIGNQSSVVSSFKKKKVSNDLKRKLKEFAKKATKILLVPAIAMSIVAKMPSDTSIETAIDQPDPSPIEQIIPTIEDTMSAGNFSNNILENGDIVSLENGVHYDHNSQANDGISGEIGDNEYREAGDYTVDVIAIIDSSTGNLIDYTAQMDGNLETLLKANGYSMQDIENGTITARYNVSEGINMDLDRTNAAGWVTYDKNTYQDKGNVIQNGININLEQGGKTL